MKVLHIGAKNYPPSHGGTERVVFDIVSGMSDIKSYVFVTFQQEKRKNVNVMPKGYFKRLSFILKFVKSNDIDVVHFHNETFIPLALLYSLFNSKNLLTIHGCHFTNPKYNMIQRFSILFFDILGSVLLPRLVFCNEIDQKKFQKWVPFRKIYFVPNGVNPPSKNTEIRKFNSELVFLGRISPEKNLLRLIQESDRSEKELHIYGSFDIRKKEYNEKVMNALSESKYVKWKGSVPYNKVLDTLSSYRTFIYPSLSEGLPLSVLEAASCGLNLILSNIPQHSVLKFPSSKYIDPLSFKLDVTWNTDGVLNREHVIKNYSIKKMIDGYKNIYNSLT